MQIGELISSIVAVIAAIGAIFIAIFRDKFSSNKQLIKTEAKLDAIKSLAVSNLIEPEKIRELILRIIDNDGDK